MKQYLGKDHYWWFCAKPSICNVSEWEIGTIQKHTWYNEIGHKRRVFCNFLQAKVGDITVFYESSPTMAVVALAQIVQIDPNSYLYFKKLANIKPIPFAILKDTEQLKRMEFLITPNGSFFKLSSSEYETISNLTEII